MGLVINTNVSALTTANALNKSGDSLQTSMERLSTGKQINSAADNAAGKAISTNMTKQINSLEQGINNAKDGAALLTTMDSAASEIESMAQRMTQLAFQASNETYTDTDKALLDKEYQELTKEITRVADNTTFNDIKLLKDDAASVNIKVDGSGTDIALAGHNLTANGLGLDTTGIGGITTAGVAAEISNTAIALDGTQGDLSGATANTDQIDITYTVGTEVRTAVIDLSAADLAKDFSGTSNGGLDGLGNALNKALENAGLGDALEFKLETGSGELEIEIVEKNFSAGQIDITAIGLAGSELGFGATQSTSTATANSVVGVAQVGKDAGAALTALDQAMKDIISTRTGFGAQSNRLDHTVASMESTITNTSAARSQIEDADFATETTNLARAKVLQNAGIAMLQQANSQTSNVEQLLR